MITRLEATLGRSDLASSMVLLARPKKVNLTSNPDEQTISFVVGYSGSAHSQAALDLALCVAHQTRLAKPNPVMVHVVYVVDKSRPRTIANADRILWQARCLASEWRGSLDAHLRIGEVATELSTVAREMDAEVLMLGCHTAKHQLVRRLADHTPCSVLGLPQ
ncbi:universal stress protein [Nodosilinea sp. E11]|uniref:universal stress protein n=1 Tax=Nodosilinea sp. E11 TaxID=3037479 RepID=UPI0029345B70|nr:universal stress protein [Nodosilinea sp. E11]WOD38921.1 universal stress protein [Nodosilinea sp. E11]